eukprot:339117-Chlamydomonas_euryale.AAC.1
MVSGTFVGAPAAPVPPRPLSLLSSSSLRHVPVGAPCDRSRAVSSNRACSRRAASATCCCVPPPPSSSPLSEASTASQAASSRSGGGTSPSSAAAHAADTAQLRGSCCTAADEASGDRSAAIGRRPGWWRSRARWPSRLAIADGGTNAGGTDAGGTGVSGVDAAAIGKGCGGAACTWFKIATSSDEMKKEPAAGKECGGSKSCEYESADLVTRLGPHNHRHPPSARTGGSNKNEDQDGLVWFPRLRGGDRH